MVDSRTDALAAAVAYLYWRSRMNEADVDRLEPLQHRDGPFRCGCHAQPVVYIEGFWCCQVSREPTSSVLPEDDLPEARDWSRRRGY